MRTPDRYIKLVEAGEPAEAAGEDLDEATSRHEGLQLALRTRRAFPRAPYPGWEADPALCDLVEPSGPRRLALTRRGRLLANEVSLRLIS